MPSCVYLKCTNNSSKTNKTQGITFHAFPQDELLKHKWLVIVRYQRREPDWMPSIYSRVCSNHFRPEDVYKTNNGLARIKKDALPYFEDPSILFKLEPNESTSSRPDSPNSLHDVNISDLDEVFESQRVAYLKTKMRKILLSKRKVMRDNKNLKRMNKRLAARCKALKVSLGKLKKVMGWGEDTVKDILSKAEAADF